jgi:hypothetical protein
VMMWSLVMFFSFDSFLFRGREASTDGFGRSNSHELQHFFGRIDKKPGSVGSSLCANRE